MSCLNRLQQMADMAPVHCIVCGEERAERSIKIALGLRFCKNCYRKHKIGGFVKRRTERDVKLDKKLLDGLKRGEDKNISTSSVVRLINLATFGSALPKSSVALFLTMAAEDKKARKLSAQRLLVYTVAARTAQSYGSPKKTTVSSGKALILIKLAEQVTYDLYVQFSVNEGIFLEKEDKDGNVSYVVKKKGQEPKKSVRKFTKGLAADLPKERELATLLKRVKLT
ncbi:MAG: hypothetical protein ACE5OZ_00080 [Candidatus Heimdallarchaeota archaeon]